MKPSLARFAAVAVLGLLAPLWWTWLISKLTLGFFIVAGSPEAPSALFAWTSILLPTLILGLATGFAIGFLSARPVVGWVVFLASLTIGSLLLIGFSTLRDLVASPGTWAFVLSTLVGSMLSVRANNSFKPKPFRGSA